MKYAIIGCGRIAVNHIKAVANNSLDLVAMCDIDSSKFDIMLEKAGCGCFPEAKRYADYKQMLTDHPEIELVAIATESGKHARIALDCIDAGKHLIIEKPMAMSIADADEIIRRADEKGVKVSACHQNRLNVAA
ncbi:Gfo/Idh/MocA family protein [Adlercreutzia sp. ZJ138]|uniref:Gfo/Idh/MocA family protein n=1 Tax=Adlercreutzia sp. ZJ138 TaxID=2709405 RepID=UPI0013EE332F|nr:Gfo/Idh/MocA family oxidoreductase [Adlercreutzia sp. ZJ138]